MKERASQPHPIPAVRAIIEDAQGRILIVRRAATQFGQGAWCLPGGKVDYGQTIESALANEIREELSLGLMRATFLFYQDSLPTKPEAPHYINFYFHCTTRGDIVLNSESSASAWITAAELNAYTLVFKNDEAIRRYLSQRSPHALPTKAQGKEDHA